jgi:hypothetical protein
MCKARYTVCDSSLVMSERARVACALHGKAIAAARSLSNAVDTYLPIPLGLYVYVFFFPVRVRLATGKTRVFDSPTRRRYCRVVVVHVKRIPK